MVYYYRKGGVSIRHFTQVRLVALNQLFASIPKQYSKDFTAQIHKSNMTRFAAQCIVLVGMDLIYLMLSLFAVGGFVSTSAINIYVVSIKIILMLLGYLYFVKISKIPFEKTNNINKRMDIINPLIHFALEFLLFVTGPLSLSALIRMSAVPFICGSIPIIKQTKAIFIETIVFFCLVVYLPISHYYPPLDPLYSFVNIWLVVYVCANLLSFVVYSAQVQNFILSKKEYETRKKVERISRLDELTQIHNRRMMTDYLESAWHDESLKYTSLSAVLFDIDSFKKLNDTYGHKKGDECLISVASVAQQIADDHGFKLARYGGEEFLLVAFEKNHVESVEMAEELRIAIANLKIPNINSDIGDTVTASFGVATQKLASAQFYGKIIEWADECLYFAKNAGRNRVAHREDRRSKLRILGDDNNGSTSHTHKSLEDFRLDYAFVYYRQKDEIEFSKSAMKLFNLPEKLKAPVIENIRKTIDIPSCDFEVFEEKLQNSLKRKAPLFTTEFRMKSEDGSIIWITIIANCIYSSKNELEAIHGTIYNKKETQ